MGEVNTSIAREQLVHYGGVLYRVVYRGHCVGCGARIYVRINREGALSTPLGMVKDWHAFTEVRSEEHGFQEGGAVGACFRCLQEVGRYRAVLEACEKQYGWVRIPMVMRGR